MTLASFETILPFPDDRYLNNDCYFVPHILPNTSTLSSHNFTYSHWNDSIHNTDSTAHNLQQQASQLFRQSYLPTTHASSSTAFTNQTYHQSLNTQFDATLSTSTRSPQQFLVRGPTLPTNRCLATAPQKLSMHAATHNIMGSGVVPQAKGLKRSRGHQRTPSASTVASNGPTSPFVAAAPYTQIANTDNLPVSPTQFVDQTYSKALPTPSQTPTDSVFLSSNLPSHFTQMPSAHLAMRDFAIQHHADTEHPPDFAPSRQSMSSHGNDSPATPQSGLGDVDLRAYNTLQQGEDATDALLEMFGDLPFEPSDVKQSNPNLQLFRSDSQQAYQDELFSPHTVYNPVPATSSKPQSQPLYLSPHRNLINQRLETANLYRSNSPTSVMSRERSPFRDGSLLAPARDWRSAAQLRQQQKEESEQAEYAQHRPTLQREPTKTISPKDALLDYHESVNQAPLFPADNLPVGYETHRGGSEQWPTNTHTFGSLDPSSQPSLDFRDATGSESYAAANLTFPALPQSLSDQIQSNSVPAQYTSASTSRLNNFDSPPHFPAPLPSMETSNSDTGLGMSSQEEVSSKPQRPADTRANTGAYTCTYHGCTQRFDSQPNLQRHKRDVHRVAPGTSTASESVSPRGTESPVPVGSGMTSAAISARNSQAGPHKCDRINPSTGKPCNTIFSRPYDLTRHEDTIHNNRKQKVRCQYCREEKLFSRTDALTRHMRVVHPEMEASNKRGRRSD